jgi:electron transport complex protein RnfD
MIKLKVGNAPHIGTSDTIRKVMVDVLIALIPAVIAATLVFGIKALLLSIFGAVVGEILDYLIKRYMAKKKEGWDGSGAVTGLLLALNVGIGTPWWALLIGLIFALAVAKHAFGGLGQNIFNPALAGRVFLLISLPSYMTGKVFLRPDAVTSATPLTMFSDAGHNVSAVFKSGIGYWDLFVGKIGGTLGETSALALLIGFFYLVFRKRIKLMVPISYVSTTFLFALIGWLIKPQLGDPLFHIFSGGLMLGALFMATDMVTSPMTPLGQAIFGFGAGALTYIIRIFGAYPEGVSFSILIMNGLVPLIDMYAKPRIFGEVNE